MSDGTQHLRGNARALFAALTLIAVLAIPAVAGAAAPGQGTLPDDRAWEMVSPPDKNGGDVAAVVTRTRAEADGSKVGFISLTGFGDVQGTGIAAEYLSERDGTPGTNGWSTHSILPKLESVSVNGVLGGLGASYEADFSEDFSKAVLRTSTNLSGDPNLNGISNLFLRDDLSTPGSGAYEPVSACPFCSGPLTLPFAGAAPIVVGESADLGHIVFETKYKLTADAPAQPAGCVNFGFGCRPVLYEWDHATLRYVAILPASEGGTAATSSFAGFGPSSARYTERAVSADGSRIFFTVPASTGDPTGRLYVRENHSTTVRINASERTVPDAEQPAKYEYASRDGSVVFFTSAEQLTNTAGSGLYMYDLSRPASDPDNLTLLSVDNEPDDLGGGVPDILGASDDGGYVYFFTSTQLVDGEPLIGGSGSNGIFLWHAGTISYVGTLNFATSDRVTNRQGKAYGTGPLESRVTPDGRYALFTAHNGDGLTGYDHDATGCGGDGVGLPCSELYLYSADGDSLTCVSCKPGSTKATSDASFVLTTGGNASSPTSYLTRPMTADGSHVFFTSGERLVPEDRNGSKRDVYEYDTTDGSLHLISSGRSVDDSYFLDASADGSDVFFATRERLSGWDQDDGYDLYDARVGGGFPEPPAPAAPCGGEVCQGSPPANVPGELGLASTRVFGPGNAAAGAKQRKHGKKRHHRKRHAHERTVDNHRRASR